MKRKVMKEGKYSGIENVHKKRSYQQELTAKHVLSTMSKDIMELLPTGWATCYCCS